MLAPDMCGRVRGESALVRLHLQLRAIQYHCLKEWTAVGKFVL